MKGQVTNFTSTLWAGLNAAFTSFMNFFPSLLGAIVILVAGWFVAKIIGSTAVRILNAMKLDRAIESANISGYLPHSEKSKKLKLSTFIGVVTKWFIFLIFVQAAVITLGIHQLTGIINSIILFIPNILVAAVILIAGAWGAQFVSGMVEKSTPVTSTGGTNTFAVFTRYGILGFTVIAAISQLGIATNLINILFTGLVASLALAFGLAFGLGGQSAASNITKSMLENNRFLSNPRVHKKVSEHKIDKDLNH